MAQHSINIGTAANDGTGDTLRVAFGFINTDFGEVYSTLGTHTTSIAACLTIATAASTYLTIATAASTYATISAVSGKEASLSNPDTDGKVLASTTGGTRSWVTLPTAFNPAIPGAIGGTTPNVAIFRGDTPALTARLNSNLDDPILKLGILSDGFGMTIAREAATGDYWFRKESGSGGYRFDSSIFITPNGGGFKLKSPDGTAYNVTVANGGTISVVAA